MNRFLSALAGDWVDKADIFPAILEAVETVCRLGLKGGARAGVYSMQVV